MEQKKFNFRNLLAGVIMGAFITALAFSCSNEDKTKVPDSDTTPQRLANQYGLDSNFCNPDKYTVAYKKEGYVLLRSTSLSDSIFKDEKSKDIPFNTASRMVRYYYKVRRQNKYPYVIDFDYNSVNKIIARLDQVKPDNFDKKNLRIYLSAYDSESVKEFPDAALGAKHVDYVTAVLVGNYDGEEKTEYINLGNLCPPNCPDDEPDEKKSPLFRDAKHRTDIYP